MHDQIQEDIKRMAEADQDMRKGLSVWDPNLDKQHTERLKEIIERIGWPIKSIVGQETSDQAWLLVQHADHDVAFQRFCLELMKELPIEEVDRANIAYLEDRILLNEGKSQLYGTQFREEVDGTFGPRPIQDEERIEERRVLMGLEPFSVYKEQMMRRE